MKQVKLPLGARFGLACASVALAILLFFAVLGTVLVIDVRTAVSESGIRSIVYEMLSDAPDNHSAFQSGNGGFGIRPAPRPVLNTPRREEPNDVALDLTGQLIDMLYDELKEGMGDDLTISQERLEQLIEESTVKDYIADKTASLIVDYVMGEVTTTFKAEEIIQLIDENKEIIEELTGEPLPEDLDKQIASIFTENEIIQKVEAEGLAGFMEATGQEIPGLPSANGGESGAASILSMLMSLVRNVSSTSTLLWCIFICLLLMIAILATNLRQLGAGLRRCGYPIILVGGLFLGAHIALDNLPDSPALLIVKPLLNQIRAVPIVTLVIGFALLAGGITLSCIVKAKRNAAAALDASAPQPELASNNE